MLIIRSRKNNDNNNNNTCHIVDFTIPADHRVKIKESKMIDSYLDLPRELKKLWNMRVIVILLVIYKHVVARKIRLSKRFSFILFISINKINKQMEYLSQLMGSYLVSGKQLLWSDLMVLSGDALSDGCGFNYSCDLHLPYLYIPDFKHQLQKLLFLEKKW